MQSFLTHIHTLSWCVPVLWTSSRVTICAVCDCCWSWFLLMPKLLTAPWGLQAAARALSPRRAPQSCPCFAGRLPQARVLRDAVGHGAGGADHPAGPRRVPQHPLRVSFLHLGLGLGNCLPFDRPLAAASSLMEVASIPKPTLVHKFFHNGWFGLLENELFI